MEITWYGHSCFRLTERGMATVVTDPYDYTVAGYEPLKLKAEIVTISHDSPGHNYISAVKGDPKIITGAGEYEIGDVFITGIQTDGVGKKNEGEIRNTLYVFDYFGLVIAHLGDMSHVPTQAEVESLGPVHIALVPVGAGGSLNAAKAAEVISVLEPNIVIPMHYATSDSKPDNLESLNKFTKEMGLTAIETLPSLKITLASLPEETHVYTLEYDHAKNGNA
jgi:L-ascorbate metabolism protein UlaG (beta-lactamase superfamily)